MKGQVVKIRSGKYFVKSENGFYEYKDGRAKEATEERDEKFLKVYHALYEEEKDRRF